MEVTSVTSLLVQCLAQTNYSNSSFLSGQASERRGSWEDGVCRSDCQVWAGCDGGGVKVSKGEARRLAGHRCADAGRLGKGGACMRGSGSVIPGLSSHRTYCLSWAAASVSLGFVPCRLLVSSLRLLEKLAFVLGVLHTHCSLPRFGFTSVNLT